MPKKKKSHEENLKTVCCVCGRKSNRFQNVTQNLAEKVRHFQPSYDRHGGVHPTAICDSCRKAVGSVGGEKDPKKETYDKVPSLLDYSAIKPPGVTTRGNSDCSCSFCAIGGLRSQDEKKHNKQISNPVGRPAGEVEKETDATPNLNISIKSCDYCKAEIRQGVKHQCNQSERRRNMAEQLKTASRGTLETVAGIAVKEKPKTFTVTPKIHIVMFHVQQYIELMNAEEEEGDRGLGYMSEQAFEAVHSHMKRLWEDGWKISTTHKGFGAKLRKFVVAYNSNNM